MSCASRRKRWTASSNSRYWILNALRKILPHDQCLRRTSLDYISLPFQQTSALRIPSLDFKLFRHFSLLNPKLSQHQPTRTLYHYFRRLHWDVLAVPRTTHGRGGVAALSHWADRRSAKGNFGCVKPFDTKTVASDEWRESPTSRYLDWEAWEMVEMMRRLARTR